MAATTKGLDDAGILHHPAEKATAMIVTWETLTLLLSWLFGVTATAIWIERRIAKMESNIALLMQREKQRKHTTDNNEE